MTDQRKWLICGIGEELFGIDLACVIEIIYKPTIIRLSSFNQSVAGIVEWQGFEVPVVDYSAVGNNSEMKINWGEIKRPVILLELGKCRLGLLVDSISEIAADTMKQSLKIDPLIESKIKELKGVIEHDDNIIFILDPNKLAEMVL